MALSPRVGVVSLSNGDGRSSGSGRTRSRINRGTLSPEQAERFDNSFNTYMETGDPQKGVKAGAAVGQPGYGMGAYAGANRPTPSQARASRLSDQYQANYASSWANNLIYSSMAPQYASLKTDTENRTSLWNLDRMENEGRLRFARQDADAAGAAVRSNLQSGEDAFARARDKNAVDLANIDIDEGFLKRQKDYLASMLGYTNRDLDLQQSIRNVDMGAVERQFPLLAKEREDITALQTNLMANLDAKDVTATKDERLKQLDLISRAAAQGAAGAALPVANAKRLAESLQEELAQSQRDRNEAKINYDAALRKNTENVAQATDARQKIIFEKERIEIERQRAAEEAREKELQRQEEEKRKALERFYAAIALQQARDQLAAQQRQAMIEMQRAKQQAEQAAFFKAIADQQALVQWAAAVQANQQREAELRMQQQQAAAALATKAPKAPTWWGQRWIGIK